VFEIAQATVNNAGRTAGRAGREVMLLNQKRAASGPGAFAGNCDAIDSAADHDGLKMFAFERWAISAGKLHI